MTNRLPIVGSDDNDWGTILNDFLSVSLNSDGTLNSSALTNAGGVTSVNSVTPSSGNVTLGPANLGSGTASSSNFLRGDGTWAIPNSGSSALANDTDVTISSPSNNQVLTYNGSKWINENLTESSIPNLVSDLSNRVELGGDIGGTTTAPTLSATSNVETIISANTTVAGAAQKANNLSDLASASTARTNLGLGSAATQASSAFDASGAAAAVQTASLQKSNNLSDLASASTARTNLGLGTASTISSTAGGDLSGTLPSPTVAKINGITLSGTPSANQVLTATSGTAANWQTAASAPVSTVFGRTGAVVATTGDYSAAQVTGALVNTNNLSDVSSASTARTNLAAAPLASPTFTGTPAAPTATAGTNTTQVATTAFTTAAVGTETTRAETAEALLAPLASPALTGSPTAPTQTTGDKFYEASY